MEWAIMGIVGVNIVVVAYASGRISQKVSDLCRRVTKLEDAINNRKK